MHVVQAKGHTGSIVFDGHFVTISRTGMSRLTVGKGDKQIPISSIAAVQWKPAGALVNGFIQFTVPGGVERRSRAGSATVNAAADENSVVFTRKQSAEFEALRAEVTKAIARQHQPQQAYAPQPVAVADELAKLAQLQQQGLLSPHEFATQKARLLGG